MSKSTKSVLDKLTALWALNESGLGGFLHIFNTPFTGLIVGGISILLISLIAFYAEHKWQAIMKALVIVLLIKMAVSPYSPVGAYLAVSFQAVFGALLFSRLGWGGFSLIALGVVTFLQSALQKLVILTVVYGNGFWDAIDIYGNWVQGKLGVLIGTSTVTILIITYLSVYALSGIFAGLFIKSIMNILSQIKDTDFYLPSFTKESRGRAKSSGFKAKSIWVWFFIVCLMVLAFSFLDDSLFGWKKGIYLVFRSFLILLLWYLVIGPIVLKLIRKYLKSRESDYQYDISQTMDLLPYFKAIIIFTWKETKDRKGYKRLKYFTAYSISNCIHFKGVVE